MIRQQIGIPEIEQLIKGDHQSFSVLVEQYTPMLKARCRKLAIREQDLDDILNDIWLKVYQGLPGYRGQATLSTWLCRISIHTAIDFQRQQRTLQNPTLRLGSNPPHEHPLEQAIQNETIDKLNHALKQLPPSWKTMISRYYWTCQTAQSIAHNMQCSSNYVRVCLYRARKKLRQRLSSSYSYEKHF